MASLANLKEITEFFEFKDGKYCCCLLDCKSKIQTLKRSALYRHFRQVHPSKLKEVIPQTREHTLALLRQETIYLVVEHVTVCGRPFSSIGDSSFRKLLNDRLEKLKGTSFQLTFFEIRENIHRYVLEMTDKIMKRISEEFSNKFYSLMFDSATKHSRAILGVNIQCVMNGELVQRNIGMEKIEQRHTGKNIANMVKDLLKKYNIPIEKLTSSTVDNAANVVNAVAQLDAIASGSEKNDEEVEEVEEEIEATDKDEEDIGSFWAEDDFQQHLLLLAANELNSEIRSILYENVDCIRCAAHTLQLAVRDGLKKSNCNDIIEKARTLVKKLRLPHMVLILEAKGCIIPPLDATTRWSYTYIMVC